MERYLTQLGVKPSYLGNTSFLENGRKAVFLKNPDPAIRVLPASLPAV